jgi:hypothetical protein
LTQKIARQPTVSMRAPPIRGPSAIATPCTLPHTPIARARACGSVNTLTMIDIATGFSIAPPIACRTRHATRSSIVGAKLHESEPALNTASPI